MNFDEVISNALLNENNMYSKKFSESWFRVNRRDSLRLHLTCRNDKKCEFSIRCVKSRSTASVKVLKQMNTHTCSLQEFKKITLQHNTSAKKDVVNKNYERSSESNNTATSDRLVVPTTTRTSTSDDDFIWSGVANEVSESESSLFIIADAGSDLPMHTATSDRLVVPTTTRTSTSDDDFIWSGVANEVSESESSLFIIADTGSDLPMHTATSYRTSTSDNDILSAENVILSTVELELVEMIAKLKKREEEEQNTRRELLDYSKNRMHKYVDSIMAVLDDFACSFDRAKVSKSLCTVVANQFGSSYVKDLFLSYSSANERNQLIFDLQLLRSCYFPEKLSISCENPLTPPLKSKRKYNFNDDDFEEVIYLDK